MCDSLWCCPRPCVHTTAHYPLHAHVVLFSSLFPAAVPPHFTARQRRAVLDAAAIAGVAGRVQLVTSIVAAAAAYGSKHLQSLRADADAGAPERFVIVVDVGAAFTSAAVLGFTGASSREVATVHNSRLGASVFHRRLFDVVATHCAAKHGVKLLPSSRAGGRALRECEKAKKVACAARSVVCVSCVLRHVWWGVTKVDCHTLADTPSLADTRTHCVPPTFFPVTSGGGGLRC